MQTIDRHGTLHAVVRRTAAGRLESGWVRIPDGSWLGIEPGATREAPWGLSDRLWHAAEPPDSGWRGTPLTVFEALDYARIDRIPALAEPARLPPGGGTAVLNLLATLARQQGVRRLAYRGPYPTEQLFLALLESFRYEPAAPDPLASFMDGGLQWVPAPHERVVAADDLYVQLRGRVEKIVWRGTAYYRPDWQSVVRHAPRRIRDAPDGVRCSLWALERAVEDHLRLTADGDLVEVLAVEPLPAATRLMPSAIWEGVVATVAARSAGALAPFIESGGGAFSLEWGPVARDLVLIGRGRVRISGRLRATLAQRLAAAPSRAGCAALGLAALAEMAGLVGDALRARAQAEILRLSPDAQAAAVGRAAAPTVGERRARAIAGAVDALLEEVAG